MPYRETFVRKNKLTDSDFVMRCVIFLALEGVTIDTFYSTCVTHLVR